MHVASVESVAVVGWLVGCREAESVRGGEVGDSGMGTGEAQRTSLMLILLRSPPPPSEPPVAREPCTVRPIPARKVLYGLRRGLNLLALGEVARIMAFPCLVIPKRFIMSFSMAGIRIERSLWSF